MDPIREAALVNAQSQAERMLSSLQSDGARTPAPDLSDEEVRGLAVADRLVGMAVSNEREDQTSRGMFLGRAMEEVGRVAERHTDHAVIGAGLPAFRSAQEALGIARKHDRPLDGAEQQAVLKALDDRGAPEVSLEVGRLVIGATAAGLKTRSGGENPKALYLNRVVQESRGLPAKEAAARLTPELDGMLRTESYKSGYIAGRGLVRETVEQAREWIAGEPYAPRHQEAGQQRNQTAAQATARGRGSRDGEAR